MPSQKEKQLGAFACRYGEAEEARDPNLQTRRNHSQRRAVMSPVVAHPLLTFSLSRSFCNSFGPIQRHSDWTERDTGSKQWCWRERGREIHPPTTTHTHTHTYPQQVQIKVAPLSSAAEEGPEGGRQGRGLNKQKPAAESQGGGARSPTRHTEGDAKVP